MEDFDEFSPKAQDRLGTPALMLAPAVLRIVLAGKEIDTELDALVQAVTLTQGARGFMGDFIYEMAGELALAVEETGISALARTTRQALDPDELALAVKIAVVAVFSSPRGEDGDIGILSAIAERLGMSEDDFTEIYESAQKTVFQP